MKRKTKEKKTKVKKSKIIVALIVLVIFSVGVGYIISQSRPKYMNNVTNAGSATCSKGFYYSFFNCLFGNCCRICNKGQYCDGYRSYACPSGTTTSGQGKTSSSACNICTDSKKWFNGSSCVSCSAPYYCKNGQRYKCEFGKTIRKTGATSESDCVEIKCSANQFINSNDQCQTCRANHYCDGKKEYACPSGKISSAGQTSCVCPNGKYPYNSFYCQTCDKGNYCVNGKKTVCAKGTYQDTTGQTSCKTCPNNFTTKTTGAKSSSECNVCKAGTYKSGNSCKPCPSAFTSNVGATSINQCYGTVPAGKSLTCTSTGCTVKDCTGNTYSTTRTVNYSTSLKALCTNCPSGKVANSNNTSCVTPTVNCKSGQYNVKNQCKSCPGCNGMVCFATPSNATRISQCYTTVPAGKYITCTSAVCTVSSCTGNTYSNAQSVSFKSGLSTKCTSCGKKKANKNHTACV